MVAQPRPSGQPLRTANPIEFSVRSRIGEQVCAINWHSAMPIYEGGRLQPTGYVRGDTFYTTIRSTFHFLRRPLAIENYKQSLREAGKIAQICHVTDLDTGSIYRCALADIWRFGFDVRWSYGNKIGLPLDRWQRMGGFPQKP